MFFKKSIEVFKYYKSHLEIFCDLFIYSMRLLKSGSVEIQTGKQMFHMDDPKLGKDKSAGINPWSLKMHKRQLSKMMKYKEKSPQCSRILKEKPKMFNETFSNTR